ncbi:MAG TPA: response regulator [Polyangiaceae bacterium]|jgi:PAS domain S-box-containing protein|nr:response regulator [Polyangiaceae bacterium]
MTTPPPAEKTVLVVEDERVVAKDLQRTLIRLGYRVPVTVASAEDAVRAVAQECPDIVLMDIRIRGDLDGIETARILKKRFDVPVIYLTAYADSETVARAKSTEPLGYLLKPVKLDELRSTVEVALHKHEMERRLRERERWFSTTLRSIGDAVVSTDASGRVTFMNPVAETLTGWSTTEARGRHVSEVVHLVDESTNQRLEDPISSALKSGRIIHVDGSLVAREGHQRAIADSAAPIVDDDGSTVGAVIVFRDVGEQRKVQHDLELTDRLASLGTMVASVAHEINNPLTLVMGGIGLALDELRRRKHELGSPRWLEDLCATLSQAEYGSEQIRNIVADLRTLSRPSADGTAIDVRRMLNWAIEAASHELRGRVKVTTSYAKTPRVHADETRLGQVFVNLLVNAAQAMMQKPRGESELKVTTSLDAEGRVAVEIADNGPGIPGELLEKIFDPFFTTKKESGGTGLGLSICRGIVTSLGGTVTVESTVGQGTTFKVTLAPAPDDGRAAPSVPPPSSTLSAKVLVIDDEPMILKLAQRVLGTRHEVVLAEGARAALDALDRGDLYDVILCDVLMPGFSGVDLHEQILLRYPALAPRVVFVSASAFTPRSFDFLASVPNRCLSKPFDRGELERAVLDVLREQGVASAQGNP